MKQHKIIDRPLFFVGVKRWVGTSVNGYYHVPLLYFAFGKNAVSITILGFNVTIRIGKKTPE